MGYLKLGVVKRTDDVGLLAYNIYLLANDAVQAASRFEARCLKAKGILKALTTAQCRGYALAERTIISKAVTTALKEVIADTAISAGAKAQAEARPTNLNIRKGAKALPCVRNRKKVWIKGASRSAYVARRAARAARAVTPARAARAATPGAVTNPFKAAKCAAYKRVKAIRAAGNTALNTLWVLGTMPYSVSNYLAKEAVNASLVKLADALDEAEDNLYVLIKKVKAWDASPSRPCNWVKGIKTVGAAYNILAGKTSEGGDMPEKTVMDKIRDTLKGSPVWYSHTDGTLKVLPQEGIDYTCSTNKVVNSFLWDIEGNTVEIVYSTECFPWAIKDFISNGEIKIPAIQAPKGDILLRDDFVVGRFTAAPAGLWLMIFKEAIGEGKHNLLKKLCKYPFTPFGSRMVGTGKGGVDVDAFTIVPHGEVFALSIKEMDKALYPYAGMDGLGIVSASVQNSFCKHAVANDDPRCGQVLGVRHINGALFKGATLGISSDLLLDPTLMSTSDNLKIRNLPVRITRVGTHTGAGNGSGCISNQVLSCVDLAFAQDNNKDGIAALTRLLGTTTKAHICGVHTKATDIEALCRREPSLRAMAQSWNPEVDGDLREHVFSKTPMQDMLTSMLKDVHALQLGQEITRSYKIAPDVFGACHAGEVMVDMDACPEGFLTGRALMYRSPSALALSMGSCKVVDMPHWVKKALGGKTYGLALIGMGMKSLYAKTAKKFKLSKADTLFKFLNQTFSAKEKTFVLELQDKMSATFRKYHKDVLVRLNGADFDGDAVALAFCEHLLIANPDINWDAIDKTLSFNRDYEGLAPEKAVEVYTHHTVDELALDIANGVVADSSIGAHACSILTANYVFGRGLSNTRLQEIVSGRIKAFGLKDCSLGELFKDMMKDASCTDPWIEYLRACPKKLLDMKASHAAAVCCLQAAVDAGSTRERLRAYAPMWASLTYGVASTTLKDKDSIYLRACQTPNMIGIALEELFHRGYSVLSCYGKAFAWNNTEWESPVAKYRALDQSGTADNRGREVFAIFKPNLAKVGARITTKGNSRVFTIDKANVADKAAFITEVMESAVFVTPNDSNAVKVAAMKSCLLHNGTDKFEFFGNDTISMKIFHYSMDLIKKLFTAEMLEFMSCSRARKNMPAAIPHLNTTEHKCYEIFEKWINAFHSTSNEIRSNFSNEYLTINSAKMLTYSGYIRKGIAMGESKHAISFKKEFKRLVIEDVIGSAITQMAAQGIAWFKVLSLAIAKFIIERREVDKTYTLFSGVLQRELGTVDYKSFFMPLNDVMATCVEFTKDSDTLGGIELTGRTTDLAVLDINSTYVAESFVQPNGRTSQSWVVIGGVRLFSKNADIIFSSKALKGLKWKLITVTNDSNKEGRSVCLFIPVVDGSDNGNGGSSDDVPPTPVSDVMPEVEEVVETQEVKPSVKPDHKTSVVVKYKDAYYIWYGVSSIGTAKLIDSKGVKFSGTPKVNKLEIITTIEGKLHNGYYYVQTKSGVFCCTSGNKTSFDQILEIFG